MCAHEVCEDRLQKGLTTKTEHILTQSIRCENHQVAFLSLIPTIVNDKNA
jgi:nitrite reductase/ring-hydroxylating ferredoxin subunit